MECRWTVLKKDPVTFLSRGCKSRGSYENGNRALRYAVRFFSLARKMKEHVAKTFSYSANGFTDAPTTP